MKILNHLLFDNAGKQVAYRETPNRKGKYVPLYLIMHYTAATTAESAVSWFMSKKSQASAHLVIGRDGTITQCAPFNLVVWHAGQSQWKGLLGLNQYSIGIELVNAGRLIKSSEKWLCPVDRKRIADKDVILAIHKNENSVSAWHEYTELQIEAALEVAALLVSTYNLKDVLGHDDISPIRKSDPGPAFPMSSFRARAMGRKNDTLDNYIIAANLNIRSGPGTSFSTLTEKSLPPGTQVTVLKTEGTWSFVEVTGTVFGIMDLEGWVSSKHLKPA